MLAYDDLKFVFVVVEIDWNETDCYSGYSETRSILCACNELENARSYIEETAEIFGKPFKWSDNFNYYYYEDDGHYRAHGVRFTIKTVRML